MLRRCYQVEVASNAKTFCLQNSLKHTNWLFTPMFNKIVQFSANFHRKSPFFCFGLIQPMVREYIFQGIKGETKPLLEYFFLKSLCDISLHRNISFNFTPSTTN